MNILLVEKYSILRTGIGSCIKNKYPDLNLTVSPLPPDPAQVRAYEIIVLGISAEKATYKNISLIRELISAKPGIRILLYDGLPGSYDQIPVYLKAGIWGYTSLWTDTENDFLAGLESLMKGLKYLDPKALHWLLNNPKKHPATPSENGVKKLLTSKELQIALALIGGKSITSIARESQRAASTVSTIKKKILEKTSASNLIELKEALDGHAARRK